MPERLDGPRLAELFLAEIVGRNRGAFDGLTVDGLDDPAGFVCSPDERYLIRRDGQEVAEVVVETAAIVLTFQSTETPIRIESSESLKRSVDTVVERTT